MKFAENKWFGIIGIHHHALHASLIMCWVVNYWHIQTIFILRSI